MNYYTDLREMGGLFNKIKLMRGVPYFFYAVLLFTGNLTYSQDTIVKDTTNINKQLHPEYNVLQFYDRSVLENFKNALNQADKRKVSIVHVGDSHLQSDIFPGQIRKAFQAKAGDGGRGMMFAYSTAKTYSSIEYQTTHTGDWQYGKSFILPPKVPLGVSGMSCRTTDSFASFTFKFKSTPSANYDVLKIFFKNDINSYDFVVEVDNVPFFIDTDAFKDSIPFIQIKLPPVKEQIRFKVVKSDPAQKEFEFYGMSFETSEDKGVIYHNVGVGGARYQSILYQELFQKQLSVLKPDLVILDFGTNDYLYDDSLKAELESEIIQVIGKIRSVAPNASIILTTAHDLYRKGLNIRSGKNFSFLIHKIAKENKCAVYDWYWISGGNGCMLKWVEKEYAQKDMIHLTQKGYELKGKMFSEAIMNTIDMLNKNNIASNLIPVDSALLNVVPLEPDKDKYKDETGKGKKIIYKVKSGDTLSEIGKKYKVSVRNIQKWNGLKTSRIRTGQKLVIYR